MYFDKCLFPVTPEKISIKINGNNKTVNLINEGEINILKKAGLTDIEFEAEIPQVKHPYAVYKNIWWWIDGINHYANATTGECETYVADHGFADDI